MYVLMWGIQHHDVAGWDVLLDCVGVVDELSAFLDSDEQGYGDLTSFK